MTKRFHVLTQQLFQKNIDECTVEELETLAHEHPYFAPAQYALLTKLKESNSAAYAAQFQKAILYYHDALSFDQFINAEDYEIDLPPRQEIEEVFAPEKTETKEILETIIAEPEDIRKEKFTEEIEEKNDEKIEEQNNEEEAIGVTTAITNETKVKEHIVSSEIEESLEQSEIQNEPLPATKTTEPTNDLTFEPYHTVDYFASQGIKLSQEEATKDKFGKQLKSFTEWLKTMKRIPAAEQIKTMDDGAEKKVENLAAHSVEGEDVYTETMAEVWVRQGNREKAIEIYNKLSLLNPSKRAYFAAKIDSLKI